MRFQRWISGLVLYGIAVLVQAANIDLVTYYHVDHLSSPVATTDERGELLSRQYYHPYGERNSSGFNSILPSIGFTGHMQNDPNDLVYAGARYQDPVLGRFISVDPVGILPSAPASFNRYAYAGNNPYRFFDPDGRFFEDAVVATASIAASSYSLGNNIESGEYGWAAVDVGAIVLDSVAVFVPGVPGAAGLTVQTTKGIRSVAIEATQRQTMYHYTSAEGLGGILSSRQLNPSIKANNPNDARYGDGQYLSDIVPGSKTCGQLARCFLGQPFPTSKFSHYVEVDVTGLDVVKGRDGVFVIPNDRPLDLTDRIISVGSN